MVPSFIVIMIEIEVTAGHSAGQLRHRVKFGQQPDRPIETLCKCLEKALRVKWKDLSRTDLPWIKALTGEGRHLLVKREALVLIMRKFLAFDYP